MRIVTVRPLAALVLVAAAAACGESPATSQPADLGVGGGDPCAAMREACLVNQMACVVEGGAASCKACATGQYADATATCVAIDGTPQRHDFSEFTTQPGEEVLGLCQSWTLGNATELWVTAVELIQDEASHHSNWTFVPQDKYAGPDGVWKCRERSYDQLTAALAGGVLYAQSTQANHEVQHFPRGAAVRIPPWSRIIGDVHLLNASPKAVTGRARMAIYSLAADDVKVKLVPFHLTFDTLAIPPHVTSRHVSTCNVGTSYKDATGNPWDLQVYYLLPHTHALGSRFFLESIGGPLDGKALIDVRGFNAEPRGRAYDPPLDLRGATGLRFGCEHTNPRDAEIKWGFGDQEMCEVLGFGASTRAFESRVDKVAPAGMDGTIPLISGDCNTLAFPWDHGKPGGNGP